MRKLPEWIGKTDDSAIPDSVKTRIRERQFGMCALTGLTFRPGDTIHYDHKTPLWLWTKEGTGNRESNLQAVIAEAHGRKTKAEATVRAKINRLKSKHLGQKPKKPWNAKWRKKMDGTVVEK